MNPSLYVSLLLLPLGLWAQGTAQAPVISETGPHHRVLRWSTTERDEAGIEVSVPHQVVELADGLHWFNPLTSRWEESVEAFEITARGYAVARRGPHKVLVAPNLLEHPVVDLELPGVGNTAGQRFRSSPRFLSFFDRISGRSVLLAEVQGCVGELVAPNVIVFPDAFDKLKAAIRVTYRQASWEQDVILYADPGSPADYGLDPATTQLEMGSEVWEAPTPRRIGQRLADGLEDEQLEFQTMSMGRGVAYVLGQAMESVEVGKTWANLEGRVFIVESIPYGRLRGLLERAGLARADGGAQTLAGRDPAQGREGLVRLVAAHDARQDEGRLVASLRPQGSPPSAGAPSAGAPSAGQEWSWTIGSTCRVGDRRAESSVPTTPTTSRMT
jgi:hypothetical protein